MFRTVDVSDSRKWCQGVGEYYEARVLYDFVAENEQELSVRANDTVRIAPKGTVFLSHSNALLLYATVFSLAADSAGLAPCQSGRSESGSGPYELYPNHREAESASRLHQSPTPLIHRSNVIRL